MVDFNIFEIDHMRDDGLFSYAAFCSDIEQGFTCAGLEKMPLSVVSMPDASTTMPARRNNITMSADRRSICNGLECPHGGTKER